MRRRRENNKNEEVEVEEGEIIEMWWRWWCIVSLFTKQC